MAYEQNEQNTGRELGWDDTIENDGPDFTLLPEGEYDFEVAGFERGRHGGNEYTPPCNKATLSLRVHGPEGSATIKRDMFLHSSKENALCAFFTSIGQRKRGEKLSMNWNKVIGSRGRCKVIVDTWVSDKDGKERKNNKISWFIEPQEGAATAPATPAYQKGVF